MEKHLIMTVGLPYSGKSTWASKSGYPVVCPDHIRTALHGQRFAPDAEPFVWAIATVMVKALFSAGHDCVVLDATNVTKKRRDEWVGDWTRIAKPMDTDKHECIRRAKSAGDDYIVPIIERMAEKFEPVGESEMADG